MPRYFLVINSSPCPCQTVFNRFLDAHKDALEKSCYLRIDFKIAEDAPVYDAIKRMSAHRIGTYAFWLAQTSKDCLSPHIPHARAGALAVTKAGMDDEVIGIISERDYLSKVALLGKQSRTTPVSAICTQGESNLVTVSYDETVDECMRKVWLDEHRALPFRRLTPPARDNRCWPPMFAICWCGTTPARSCRSSP